MGAVKMYKYRSKQIRLTDFNTPIGMKLNPDNRKKKISKLANPQVFDPGIRLDKTEKMLYNVFAE